MGKFFSYEDVDMDSTLQNFESFNNARCQCIPRSFNNRNVINPIDYERIKCNLEDLIQDERNAYIFYDNMSEVCDEYYEANLIGAVSQASRRNYEFLNSLYMRNTNRNFRVRNVEVIRDISFDEGLRMAISTENDINIRANDLYGFITDLKVKRRFNRYLSRKRNQRRFLNSLL